MNFNDFYLWPMLIGGAFMLIGLVVSSTLRRKFKKYAQTPLMSGMSGAEVAQKMLDDHNIGDVQVLCLDGQLTDHYNPMKRTVNLSRDVYEGRNAAATAVAAHECGHAVQHATGYSMLKFRSAMVPLQNVSGMLMNLIVMASIFGGYALYAAFPLNEVLYVVVGSQAVITLFTIVTLPVEFDASNRALAWVKSNGVVTSQEYGMAKDALKWAAMTYVVAALAAIANLLYWVMMLLGADE